MWTRFKGMLSTAKDFFLTEAASRPGENYQLGFQRTFRDFSKFLSIENKSFRLKDALAQSLKTCAPLFFLSISYYNFLRPLSLIGLAEDSYSVWAMDLAFVVVGSSFLPKFYVEDTMNNLSIATSVGSLVPNQKYYVDDEKPVIKIKDQGAISVFDITNSLIISELSFSPRFWFLIKMIVNPLQLGEILNQSRFDSSKKYVYEKLAENNAYSLGKGHAVILTSFALTGFIKLLLDLVLYRITGLPFNTVFARSEFLFMVVDRLVLKAALLGTMATDYPLPGGEPPFQSLHLLRYVSEEAIRITMARVQNSNQNTIASQNYVMVEAKSFADLKAPKSFSKKITDFLPTIVYYGLGKEFASTKTFVRTPALKTLISINEGALRKGFEYLDAIRGYQVEAIKIKKVLSCLPDFFIPYGLTSSDVNLVYNVVFSQTVRDVLPEVKKLVNHSVKTEDEIILDDVKETMEKLLTKVEATAACERGIQFFQIRAQQEIEKQKKLDQKAEGVLVNAIPCSVVMKDDYSDEIRKSCEKAEEQNQLALQAAEQAKEQTRIALRAAEQEFRVDEAEHPDIKFDAQAFSAINAALVHEHASHGNAPLKGQSLFVVPDTKTASQPPKSQSKSETPKALHS